MLQQTTTDGVEHSVKIDIDLVIGKTKGFKPVLLQPLCSTQVVDQRLFRGMLAPIELDDQLGFEANKINDEWPYRLLPSKFKQGKLPIAQRLPKLAFNSVLFAP